MSTIERLHYANGRRLDADDLRLEQHYHIAMRRLLNRGLFTPGEVNGLEVEKSEKPEKARKVTVKPGLALDPLGRELIVPNETEVAVPNQPPVNKARPGYFLVIRYDEFALPGEAHPCAANGAAPEPSRIVERPLLEWTEQWPDHRNCEKATSSLDCSIVLALVTLDSACQVSGVETGSGLREYAYPVHLSQVQAVALEGEKNLDKDNPKVVHFHVRGGAPTSVLLYLWGAKFSSLYYTELGKHHHDVGGLKAVADLGLQASERAAPRRADRRHVRRRQAQPRPEAQADAAPAAEQPHRVGDIGGRGEHRLCLRVPAVRSGGG